MRTGLWPDSADSHEAEVDRFFAHPSEILATFVAEKRGHGLCGFIEAGTRTYAEGCHSSPVGYIEGWWVDPGHRRAGVGTALVAAAENWARARGLTEMASDTDLGNRLSEDSHRALGYQEAERVICFRKAL